ncbi:MAG TPA: hypothetical protein VL361_23910 [Candidatus Limnocylindrales bacterium]|jgi:hypothetical protein|nr:hypothetical protein [Candidatus Limnocylindrales bacterium]
MPIRINLLSEAQALEELRRRDPVKRATWGAVFLVCLLLAWWSSLWAKGVWARTELNRLESQLATRTNEYQQVLQNQQKLYDVAAKLEGLQQMATNRLLYGTLLNALQQTIVDDVQLLRLRAEQTYAYNDEIKPKTNANDRIIPGKPASVTEKIVVVLEARDSGANPGDQVNKFKRAVNESPYFRAALGGTNEVRLASLSPPMFSDGKPTIQFALECRYPEKTR